YLSSRCVQDPILRLTSLRAEVHGFAWRFFGSEHGWMTTTPSLRHKKIPCSLGGLRNPTDPISAFALSVWTRSSALSDRHRLDRCGDVSKWLWNPARSVATSKQFTTCPSTGATTG